MSNYHKEIKKYTVASEQSLADQKVITFGTANENSLQMIFFKTCHKNVPHRNVFYII